MQERRRKQATQGLDPTKERIQVPGHYWTDLEKKDLPTLCEHTLCTAYSSEDILVPVLGGEILVFVLVVGGDVDLGDLPRDDPVVHLRKGAHLQPPVVREIGRASCRERV